MPLWLLGHSRMVIPRSDRNVPRVNRVSVAGPCRASDPQRMAEPPDGTGCEDNDSHPRSNVAHCALTHIAGIRTTVVVSDGESHSHSRLVYAVLLVGRNQQSVRRVRVRYEFPGATFGEDADWIVIDGKSPQFRDWTFQDAALLTADCPLIRKWLLHAADSQVPVTKPHEDPSLTFLEPSLAFSVASYGDQVVTLRVHLSHQAAPPWQDIYDKLNTWTLFVELPMGIGELQAAAADWNREAEAFPRRTSR